MAGIRWMLLGLAMFFWSRACLMRAEFTELPWQSDLWTAYYSLAESDCYGPGKFERFPEIYGNQNDVTTSIGAPVNMKTSYILKEYQRRRLRYGRLFPGIVVEFSPPRYGWNQVTGYEIILNKTDGVLCIVLDLEEVALAKQEGIHIELHPLSGNTYFKVNAASLPLFAETQRTSDSKIMTGLERFLPLPAPVYWVAAVTYEVTRRDEERWLEVVFSSAPPQFRFRRFEVALLPDDTSTASNRESSIRIVTTETCYITFENVPVGQYKLQIRPVDEFFSIQGLCLCHYRGGACSTCLTTEVHGFTVT